MKETFTVEEAIEKCREHWIVARLSPLGRVLVLYDGDVASPGTWMEIARCTLDRNGAVPATSLRVALLTAGIYDR